MALNHCENEGISILEIHDETLSQDVHATFSPRNQILAYGVQRLNKNKNWENQYLHEVSTKAALYNDHVRKLVNESHGVFLSLNAKAQTFQDGIKSFEISKISQKYRSVLLACIEELADAANGTGDEELMELKDMFSDIELIWHLVQSLIIDSHSGLLVLYKLLDWIKWHFLFGEQKMEAITKEDNPASHPEFWDTVIQFLLQGKVASARSLLELHPKYNQEDFASLDELLRKMPMYSATCGMSLNEFRIRWKHWQQECKTRLGELSSDSNLKTVCKVLCGDPDILTEKSYLCYNWYHLMISVQLYTDPYISFSSLANIARVFYNNVMASEQTKPGLVDTIILAAMELDIFSVINLSCSFNDGWWFAVHMMDMLTHGKYIDSKMQQNSPLQYRNYLLMNYADTLMSHSSLWEVGVNYLDQCQENGRELLEAYLERIPLETESKARRIIHIARKRNLENLVKTVSNVMTSRAIKNGKIGTALTWVMHSRDVNFADELADRWMKDYAEKKKTECFDILHNMGSCLLVSDKLTFVGKYCEFHKLYGEKNYKAAAALLVSLISSGVASPSFQMVMLIDALPLLESTELIFSSKDTNLLQKCLEDIVTSKESKETEEDCIEEGLIRLALIRNLARSFVLEPFDSELEDRL